MATSDAAHPNLRPDPARVQRWRDQIEHLREKVTELVMYRHDFAAFEKIVHGNVRIIEAENPFPTRVMQWYRESQMMRIRRILEEKNDDVHSLRRLLEDMRSACAAFTRGSIEELFDVPDAPDYDPEVRGFLVSSMWGDVGDTVKNEDRLCSKHIKNDLAALNEVSARIINYANKMVAHDTREGVAEADQPRFSEIAACIDTIDKVTVRYITALTGAGYRSLAPIAQYDELDVFQFAWLPGDDTSEAD